MYSPLCGIVTSIGYSLRSRSGPRVFVAGGELTGVHALLGQDAPKPGSYHIGGSGLQPFEPDIRVFAEATERYSSAVAVLGSRHPMRWTTHDRLREEGEPVLDAALLSSYDGPGRLSPYDGFRSDAPMTWVRLPRVFGPEGDTWVPAQLFFVGYTPKRHDGEPWLQAAVTTGTAVHTSYDRALAAAIYEIIQVDATMGHWYGASSALRIGSDERTARIDSIIKAHGALGEYAFDFYLIPSSDLPNFSVACLIRERQGNVPIVSVGLGADASLERAMYKAFLEGSGVRMLAEWGAVTASLDGHDDTYDAGSMYDLDTNVSYYARPGTGEAVLQRFSEAREVAASDLPGDLELGDSDLARHLVSRFEATGKELYFADITPGELRGTGFRSVRLWCPQTLSLCLPSAPAGKHPRFRDYGGFQRADPHPYP